MKLLKFSPLALHTLSSSSRSFLSSLTPIVVLNIIYQRKTNILRVGTHFTVKTTMAIQACFNSTGLSPEDAQVNAQKSGWFDVVPPTKNVLHLMLYLKCVEHVSIQILGQGKANIWCGFHELDEIKGFLNKTLGDNLNPKPFKEPYKISFKEGELRRILENNLLGLACHINYCYPDVVAEALDHALKSMDYWNKGWTRPEKCAPVPTA